jgi:hypothetical protein
LKPVIDTLAVKLSRAFKHSLDGVPASFGLGSLVGQIAFAALLARFFVDVFEALDFGKGIALSNHVRAERDAGRSRVEHHHAAEPAYAAAPGRAARLAAPVTTTQSA